MAIRQTWGILSVSGNIAVLNKTQYIVVSRDAALLLISYQKPTINQLGFYGEYRDLHSLDIVAKKRFLHQNKRFVERSFP